MALTNPACQVIFARNTPLPTAAIGAPFGFSATTARSAPNPGRFYASVSSAGAITNIVNPNTGLGPGTANPVRSFGGPWTTGMLTVSVTQNPGDTDEIFMLTGSDNRVNGIGNISLVAGSISHRNLSGPNANRGWLNFQVVPEPTRVLMLVAGLSLLALLNRALRRRS